MSDSAPIAPRIEAYLARADQMIVEGEKRICRLMVLVTAMSNSGYETDRIEALMAKHLNLLQSWKARRSFWIERGTTGDLVRSRHDDRLDAAAHVDGGFPDHRTPIE